MINHKRLEGKTVSERKRLPNGSNKLNKTENSKSKGKNVYTNNRRKGGWRSS